MKKLALMFLIFAIVACATPLRNQLSIASAANQSYTERTTALLGAKLITTDEAAQRLKQIEQRRDAIRLASLAVAACEKAGDAKCSNAQSQLAVATQLGTLIEAELLKREQK